MKITKATVTHTSGGVYQAEVHALEEGSPRSASSQADSPDEAMDRAVTRLFTDRCDEVQREISIELTVKFPA